jgi:hypothetical protein
MVTACAHPAPRPSRPNDPAHILWLPDGVRIDQRAVDEGLLVDGRTVDSGGMAYVAFTIDSGSREELSTSIVHRFFETGWTERRTRYVNPWWATSFLEGWRHQCACVIPTDRNGRRLPSEPYSDWEGEWEDRDGDIVTYDLSAVGVHLRGFAQYVPARAVAETRQALHLSR